MFLIGFRTFSVSARASLLFVLICFSIGCSSANGPGLQSTDIKPATPAPEIGSPPAMTDELILEKVKKKIEKDFPGDTKTQNYVYDQQLEAFNFMKLVPASLLKSKLERDYSYDFSVQKFTYKKQMEAKEYIESLPSSDLKNVAVHKYPNDYSLQKFIYDQQMEAKEYMDSLPASPVKAQSEKEYPTDYTLQKYKYNQQIEAQEKKPAH